MLHPASPSSSFADWADKPNPFASQGATYNAVNMTAANGVAIPKTEAYAQMLMALVVMAPLIRRLA